jgi:hypothetical protein
MYFLDEQRFAFQEEGCCVGPVRHVQANTAILIRIVVAFPDSAEEILKGSVSSLTWKQQSDIF